MKVFDGGMILFLGLIIGASVVALVSTRIKGDDNAVEEIMETIIENRIESALSLPPGSLKDKIDLTPWSIETDPDDAARTRLVHKTKAGLDV